jgi:hypothetical protein
MKYNTMLDVAFSVDHNFEDSDELLHTSHGRQLVLAALAKHLAILMENQSQSSKVIPQHLQGVWKIPQCDIGIAHH